MTQENKILSRDNDILSDAMKIRFFPFAIPSQSQDCLVGADGDEIIDFTASWAVANTGYRHPTICDQIEKTLDQSLANSPISFPHEPVVELAERLHNLTPFDFSTKVWFSHSGSEAGDLISKAIPTIGNGDTVITFEGSYNGITTGAVTISGHGPKKASRQTPFAQSHSPIDFAPIRMKKN